MIWLILGVALWSGAHLIPILGRGLRGTLVARLGESPYKGLFSLAIVLAVVLMVVGWRSTAPTLVYVPPELARSAAKPLMFVALVCFFASGVPTNLKRLLRHPQLTGVAIWAGTHLLANGEGRSLVLFGGIGLWSVVAMVGINRRDGAWQKPERLPGRADLKPFVAAVVGFALLYFAHPWIAGVSIP